MIALVIGSYGVKGFLSGGIQVANLISTTLERNGLSMDTMSGILDFGCGSGASECAGGLVAEQTRAAGRRIPQPQHLIEWCQKTLPHGRFDQNVFPDPLSLGDESVDLAYSFSIFTHLDATSQSFWMSELTRVMRPGAHLLLTVHGSAYVDGLSSEDREKFEDGEMLVKRARTFRAPTLATCSIRANMWRTCWRRTSSRSTSSPVGRRVQRRRS